LRYKWVSERRSVSDVAGRKVTGTPPGRREDGVRVDMEPLMAASRAINAVVVRSLAEVDTSITVPQLRVLVMLSAHDAVNLTAVAEGLGVNASNASRTCDQLVAKSLVDRREDPHDRRHKSLALSAPGRRLLSKVMRRRQKKLQEVVDALESRDQRDLMRTLDKFNAAAETIIGDTRSAHIALSLTR
jgi:DNA-binding MarR family transcriptional regulator